jgi:ferredoxin
MREVSAPGACDKAYSDLKYPEFAEGTDCPVYWSRGLVTALSRESCGRDVLCREGSLQLAAIFADISDGKGSEDDIGLSRELLSTIRGGVNCGMMRDAADRCLRNIDECYDRWEQHVMRKRCPDLVCPTLLTVYVVPGNCTGCGNCAEVCPSSAISGGEGMIHVVDADRCTRCMACEGACEVSAIARATAGALIRTPDSPVPVGSYGDAAGGEGRRRRRRG